MGMKFLICHLAEFSFIYLFIYLFIHSRLGLTVTHWESVSEVEVV